MEETDFINSVEYGSKDEGIKVVGSENKAQESCNLQPKLDNAIVKTEIKMEDDDISQSASENEESNLTSGNECCDLQAVLDNEIVKTEIKMEDDDISDSSTNNGSKDEGNFTVGTEGNGLEPSPLEDVLDNTIVKSEIKMEEDDIIDCPTENSPNDEEVNKDVHTESNEQDNIRIGDCVFSDSEIQFLQKLRSRLPLNEIVPEHAGRKHNATTDEMPTEKETTNNSWTKLNNVLFKDGILIDNANLLHSLIQAALIQKLGQPSILNVDTEKNRQDTFECSQIEMRNLVVMKEKITLDDTLVCNSAIQSGFNNSAETNENSLNKEKRLESSEVPETGLSCTIVKAIDTTDDAHIRVSAHPINFNNRSGRCQAVTTAKKFQDLEAESVIQIVRKCSVRLERLPSIEKYCKELMEYPIGELATLRCVQSEFIQVQTNDISAEMNGQSLINYSEADKTTKENNDFLFINPCVSNNNLVPVDAEMDGQDPLACIEVYDDDIIIDDKINDDDILSSEEVYDDDDDDYVLSSEEVYDDDDDDSVLSSEEVYDDDDDYILSSEKVSNDDDDILSSDVKFVASKEVHDKVISTENYFHNPNQKIEIVHMNYKCNACGETFALKSNFQLHLLYHGNMKCLKCRRMFDDGVALNNHMQTNHNEKPSPRKKHLSIHMDNNIHNCSVCHKSFIDHKSLLNHKLIHQFTNNYKCIHCNNSYENIVHLNKHLITHDARLVESDSKEKAGSDKEVITECEFQDLSDQCIDVDQGFSDEDDHPLSVLIKQNPSKYNVKNEAGSGKEVSTELECQDMVTENNGQNPPEDIIKNKTVPIPNTEVSTDVKFQNLGDKYGNINQQISLLINRNNKISNKEVTGQSSAESNEEVFNDIEFHHDFNVDNAEMDGQDTLTCVEVYDDNDILSSDVEFVDSKEVQDKVVSTDKDLHNPNQTIEFAHKNYKCNVCDETFTLISKFQLHLLYHRNMKCLKCHRMFDNGVALNNHMQTNHNEEPPPRKKHLSIHIDKNVHNCSVCHKSFIDHKSLLNHKLIHQFTNIYKCIHCNKSYYTIVHLNKHMLTHDARPVESDSMEKVGSDEEVSTEVFQDVSERCIYVDQDFTDEDDQPLSVLTKQNPLICNVKNKAGLDKQVSTELEFQDILTENNGQNPTEDRIKNKTVPVPNTEVSTDVKFQNLSDKYGNVNQQISLLINTNRNNKSKNKELTGQLGAGSDEEIFKDIEFHQDFNVDNAEMDGEDTLACIEVYDVDVLSSDVEFVDSKEVQDKVVSTEKDLHDPNQKIEFAHKNYKCKLCDETFTLKSKCQLQLLYHRNMNCLKCHNMFDNAVALKNHMQTNHNEKPSPRKRHLSIHMDKNVHNCSVCHKSFIDDKSLLNHKRIHQFTNSYKCIHCNKSYETTVHLNKHMLIHHARPVESDSKEKERVVEDEEVSTEVFQDLSDQCKDIDQGFSDEDDQPLSVLIKQNPSKYNVKNKAGLGKQVSTELEFQDILTENNGQNPPEDRIKNKTVPVPNTEVSTDVSAEFHQDLNIDKNVSESSNHKKNYTCIGCGDMFTTTEELRKHEITHKKYECDLCENVYNQYSKYQQHLKYHIDGDKLKCLHCRKSFDSGLTLKCHMLTRNCKECRKCYCSSAALKKHIQLDHNGIHTYKCTQCHEGFLLAEELDKHSRIHSIEKPYTCPLCYKSFSDRDTLSQHLLVHSGKRYKCTKCSKLLATKKSLKVHLQSHSGVKDHICNICSKAYRYPSDLRHHVIMHTGIKPHKCPLCDTGFTHIDRLKRHLVIIHYGTKEHKCIHCNECFALLPDLIKHYAIHKDPRPYKCKKCPKSFIRQQHIITHMVTHSAVKPYQCEKCGSRFKLPHHLRNHLLTHSAKKRPKRK